MVTAAVSGRSVGPSVAKMYNKRLDRPNFSEYQTKITTERRAINDLFKRMNELTQKVQECRNGQSDYVKKRDEMRRNLDTITAKIEQLEAERSKLLAEIEERQKVGRDMRSKVQTLKRDLGFQSEQEIDEKIREIERHMMSKKLTVQDENKMIAQIKHLRNSKSLVGQYSGLEVDANSHAQLSVLPLRVRFDELRDEIRSWQQKKRDAAEKVRTLIKNNQQSWQPVNDLMEEKDKLKRDIALHRQEEQRLLQEMEVKNREYRTQALQLQKKAQERRREEQRKRETEQERESLQKKLDLIEEEGWTPEYQLAHQTLCYIQKLVEQAQQLIDSATKTPESVTGSLQVHPTTDAEGRVLVKPKNQREEEYYCAPSKRKAEKRQKKPPVASLKQPLVHDITVLSDFERLNINPPLCLADCADCLKVLEEKMAVLKSEKSLLEESVEKRKQQLLSRLEALDNPQDNSDQEDSATTEHTELNDETPKSSPENLDNDGVTNPSSGLLKSDC